MNTTQIRYFLEAARTLNFTEAAKRLYISQPALSKQINAMEGELNMQLFIRDKKNVRLTPAGLVLLEEFPKFEASYKDIIRKAKIAYEGNAGSLVIGILEGQMLGQELSKKFADFNLKYPNISVRLVRDSFSGLRNKLNDRKIDLAFSLEFDIKGNPGINYKVLERVPALAAVSKNHPAANKRVRELKDIENETIIVIEKDDCPNSSKLLFDDLRKYGVSVNVKYANSLETAMLWVEAGIGIGLINEMNNLTNNPNIKILSELELLDTFMVAAWSEKNNNPAVALLRDFFEESDKG